MCSFQPLVGPAQPEEALCLPESFSSWPCGSSSYCVSSAANRAGRPPWTDSRSDWWSTGWPDSMCQWEPRPRETTNNRLSEETDQGKKWRQIQYERLNKGRLRSLPVWAAPCRAWQRQCRITRRNSWRSWTAEESQVSNDKYEYWQDMLQSDSLKSEISNIFFEKLFVLTTNTLRTKWFWYVDSSLWFSRCTERNIHLEHGI